jgi:long-chain fatty acid transport protein
MRNRFCVVLLAGVLGGGLLAARPAQAGGFMIYEHGASATGMAGARTALWDEPSALFFNPAAITMLDGFQLQLGDTLIRPFIKYTPLSVADRQAHWDELHAENPTWPNNPDLEGTFATSAESRLFYPLHFYFTAKVLDWLSLGLGVNNQFGLGTYWPKHWQGRYVAYQTELRTFFVQPTVAVDFARAFDLTEELSLSLAAGGSYVYGDAMFKQQVDLAFFPDATMEMEGSANGGGYNLALFFAWMPWVSVGASFRSHVMMDYEGTAAFTGISPENRAFLAATGMSLPESTGGSTSIDLPMNMNFGVAFHGLEHFTFAVDAYVAFWESYDELRVVFDCSTDGTCWDQLNPRATFPKDWHTGYQISAGIEYRPIDELALRIGYGYVNDPSNPTTYDALLPDGERNLFSAGVGFRMADYAKIDVGYMLAMWENTKLNAVGQPIAPAINGMVNGTYETVTHLLAVSLSFAIDGDANGASARLDPPAPTPVP